MPSPISKSLSDFIDILKNGEPRWGIPPHNAPELLDRWSISMECQINVQSVLGSPVEGRKGVFVDENGNEFWNMRIPKGANTNEPTFTDRPMGWALPVFAAGFGCTGWDWQNCVSRWVGFDFDALVGHAVGVGVAAEELDRVKEAACQLPWVEVRHSTSGSGLHLYVLLDAVPTENHTVHAAVARCVLGMMSTATGFDFASRIDACGGNMWVYHRKSTPKNGGLKLIKAAECSLGEIDLPVNWRDNVDVVKRKRSKVAVQGVENGSSFDKLADAQQCVTLDDKHREVITELGRMNYACEWVADHNCIRTHTKALADLCERMTIKGIFRTSSEGRDPQTANVFGFPLPNGGWRFFRFSPGVSEAPTWSQDGEGWTRCMFNVLPDLKTAARAEGGKLDGDRNGYVFDRAANAVAAIKHMGQTIELPTEMEGQDAFVKVAKSGHIAIDIAAKDGLQADMAKWIFAKKRWLYTTGVSPVETPDASRSIRYITTPANKEEGWEIKTADGTWISATKDNVKTHLVGGCRVKKSLIDIPLNHEITYPHMRVNIPFATGLTGRQINSESAPRYTFERSGAESPNHPHWDSILQHCFAELDPVVKGNQWAQENNIVTGADYGLAWIACLMKSPHQKLPYLFLWSEEQNTGKSSLYEAIALLLTGGVVDAGKALKTTGDHNGELDGGILCYIEELDLAKSGSAYNKMKAWITSPTISIRKMRTDAFEQVNLLHFIHTANDRTYCPILPGDSRIVMLHVNPLNSEIPKETFREILKREAPDFIQTINDFQLPSVAGRLWLPVLETGSKRESMADNEDPLIRELSDVIEADYIIDDESQVESSEVYERLVSRFYSRGKKPPRSVVNSRLTTMGFAKVEGRARKNYITRLRGKS